jgi:hypothetical protein
LNAQTYKPVHQRKKFAHFVFWSCGELDTLDSSEHLPGKNLPAEHVDDDEFSGPGNGKKTIVSVGRIILYEKSTVAY